VRLVVGMVARKAGVDEEGIEDLKVAVSETCAVAVTDLAWAGLDAPIELDVIVEPDRFGVEVRDRAPSAQDPPRRATEDNGDLDDRQFGLALVGALVDDLASEPLEHGDGHRTRFWLHRRGADDLPPLA
jgi:anti-sigma regulatory factor (Ser/Thr protein kinase)